VKCTSCEASHIDRKSPFLLFTIQFSGIARVNIGPCHHGMVDLWVADAGDDLQIWRVVASILNKQLYGHLIGGGPAVWVLGEGLTTPYCEKKSLLQNVTHNL
jgi:hypothetical protein